MKSIKIVVLSLLVASHYLFSFVPDASFPHERKKRSVSRAMSELIDFKFDGKSVKDVLNDFAKRRSFNIIYPETDTLTSKLTFDAERKVTLSEAWELLVMILQQAGFSLIPHGENTYMLVENKLVATEPLPIYIRIDYRMLPDSQEKIRYIYYFDNIQAQKQQQELVKILQTIFGSEYAASVIWDLNANAIIFTTKSETIKSAMTILNVLDEAGFQEEVDTLHLEYAQAAEVEKLLQSMIGSADSGAKKGAGFVQLSSGKKKKYFSEYAKVVDLEKGLTGSRKLNTLVIMGQPKDVKEIKNFIKKYLDTPMEKGNSFFHTVELQWLQASAFSQTLQNVVKGIGSSGMGQSSSSSVLNSELSFDPLVQIISELKSSSQSQKPTGGAGDVGFACQSGQPGDFKQGGNRLVIAAPTKDWERIEALIKSLDVPQKQVVIEALVMDLDLRFVRRLGAQLRTRGLCSSIFPKDMQAQAGLVVNSIVNSPNCTTDDNLVASANQDTMDLTGDLSAILNPEGVAGTGSTGVLACPSGSNLNSGVTTSAPDAFTGSTIVMLSGSKSKTNGAWGFFQLLSQHTSSKIFIRPVVTAINNQKATILSSITKNLAGTVTTGVNPTVNYETADATVTIDFTPLISDNNTVRLQVNVQITSWADASSETSGTKFTRNLSTTVSMRNGDVLILGGLMKQKTERAKRSVPFFEKIPLFGNLFSSRSKDVTKDQLFILIRPSVVAPRVQGGMGGVTRRAADFINDELTDYQDSFANLRDPITRWFFADTRDSISHEVTNKLAELPVHGVSTEHTKEQDGGGIEVGGIRLKQDPSKIETTEDVDAVAGWFSSATHNKKTERIALTSDGDIKDLNLFLDKIENPFTDVERLNV